MLNRKAPKIGASLLVIGAWQESADQAVCDASFKKEQQWTRRKIELQIRPKRLKKWDKKVNLKNKGIT
jgi:hypothetical protein